MGDHAADVSEYDVDALTFNERNNVVRCFHAVSHLRRRAAFGRHAWQRAACHSVQEGKDCTNEVSAPSGPAVEAPPGLPKGWYRPVSYTHLRAHETDSYLVCRLLL